MTDAAKLATELIKLDAKYPGTRWWLKWGEDGDFCGPCESAAGALQRTMIEWNCTPGHLFEDYDGDVTVGFWTEDALYLQHLDALVQAGVPVEKATELVEKLDKQQSEALHAVNGEDAWYGWTPVFDVQEDGMLTVTL